MPRRSCQQPALSNSKDDTSNVHCAEINKSSSGSIRSLGTKRQGNSQLTNTKSQRCSDSGEIHSSLSIKEKSTVETTGSELSVACSCKDQSSGGHLTSPDKQQLFDSSPNIENGKRLLASFFDQPCIELAHNLLGKYVVRISPEGKRLAGRIVETEGYVGTEDRASHSYGGRRTARNEAMYMPPGTCYVYNIYGIYTCMNISSRGILHLW